MKIQWIAQKLWPPKCSALKGRSDLEPWCLIDCKQAISTLGLPSGSRAPLEFTPGTWDSPPWGRLPILAWKFLKTFLLHPKPLKLMRITVKKGQGARPNIIQAQVTLPKGFKSISQRSKAPKKTGRPSSWRSNKK